MQEIVHGIEEEQETERVSDANVVCGLLYSVFMHKKKALVHGFFLFSFSRFIRYAPFTSIEVKDIRNLFIYVNFNFNINAGV